MNKNTRVMFLRDKNRRPVGCVAMQLSKDRQAVRYQVSTLNPVDKFDRALARQIALGRMLEKPKVINSRRSIKDMFEVAALVMAHLAADRTVPNRSQEAAVNWIDTQLRIRLND